MSQQKNSQHDEYYEAMEAIERLFGEPSEKALFVVMLIIGKAIATEMEQRERNTAAKAVHIRGITASREFEQFIGEHRTDIRHYERFYSEVSETINYGVILPKRFLEQAGNEEDVNRFAGILQEAEDFDFSIGQEAPGMREMIYLEISFPAVIRVYKT